MATHKQNIEKIASNTSSASTASWVSVGQNFALQRQMANHAKAQQSLLQAQLDQQWQASYAFWRQTPEGRYYSEWQAVADKIQSWLGKNNAAWDKIRLEYFANMPRNRAVQDAIRILKGESIKPAKKFRGWLWAMSGFGVLVISNAIPNLGSQLTPLFLIYLVAVLPFAIRPIMKKKNAAAFSKQVNDANALLDETEWAMSAENISCLALIGTVKAAIFERFPTPDELPSSSTLTPVFQVTVDGHPELTKQLQHLEGLPSL